MRKQKWLIASDFHAPFHDPKKVALLLKILKGGGITHLLINGDFLDFFSVNMHGPKHPDVIENLETEFYESNKLLDKIQQANPKMKIHFNFGNHESRLERFILQHCRPFWGVLKVENELRLKDRGISWLPYQDFFQINNLPIYVAHSPPSYSKNPAQTSLEKKIEGNWVWSCTHRSSVAYRPTAMGNIYEAHTIGWFGSCDLTPSHKQVFSYMKNHQQWSCSFVTIDIDKDNFSFNHHLVRDNAVSVDGKIYS